MTFRYAQHVGAGAILREYDHEPNPADLPADAVLVETDAEWSSLQAAQAASAPRYVPFATICDRLRECGKWDDFATLYAGLTTAQQLHLQTLRYGVAPDDAEFLVGLETIGADPAVILAP